MAITIRQNIMSAAFQRVKAPHAMKPIGLTIHGTGNDATACAEIRNINNNNPNQQVSFHLAVDDTEAVQAIPFNRNAWHASDGANGTGNRRTIAIEICFDRSGGARFVKAEQNAARLAAQLLKQFGWTVNDIYTHQHWDPRSQRCPRRTLDAGWQRFLNMVQAELDSLNRPTQPSTGNTHTVRSGETLTSIARQYGVTVQAIQTANNISNPNLIRVGQVLQIPNGSAPTQRFFPAVTGNFSGIVAALNSINVDSSFANRQRIAVANGITNYTGTAAQNNQMLNSLRQGRLVRP